MRTVASAVVAVMVVPLSEVPNALEFCTTKIPAATVVTPLKEFEPKSVPVPEPAFDNFDQSAELADSGFKSLIASEMVPAAILTSFAASVPFVEVFTLAVNEPSIGLRAAPGREISVPVDFIVPAVRLKVPLVVTSARTSTTALVTVTLPSPKALAEPA